MISDSAAPTRAASWFRAWAILLALLLFGLALRPAAHVYDMPMTEDGYYALAVARNIAAGAGITIDGVHLTNGFQPLFTFLQAGAFRLAGGDEVLAMRLVMVLAFLFHLGGAVLAALIARDAWPARFGAAERQARIWLTALLYLAAPLMLNHAYNGLETGCVMFLYAACARWLQTGRDTGWSGIAVFGALIGLAVLARIDAAFVAVALGLNEIRKSWRRGPAHALVRAALMGGVALLISSPWWIYNTVYFGSPMPTSGTAQQDWGLDWLRFKDAEWALRVVFFPWVFAGAHESDIAFDLPIPFAPGFTTFTLVGLVRSLALLGVMIVLIRAWRRRNIPNAFAPIGADEALLRARTLEFATCFIVAFVALIFYYVLSFAAYWFYYRYFAPLALLAFVTVPILAARALFMPGRTAPIMALALLAVVQAAVLAASMLEGRGLGGETVYHAQVALTREHVPETDAVAAGQSGTLGFFRNRVVNLDGKVNSAALAWQDRMPEYLRQQGVRWFVDWPYYVNRYLDIPLDDAGKPAAEANGWRLVDRRRDFYLYQYVGP